MNYQNWKIKKLIRPQIKMNFILHFSSINNYFVNDNFMRYFN